MAKRFKDLTEREILALAISLEEEDARIFGDFADGLRADFPASAKIFEEMQAEESEHRASLFELYKQRFGNHIPLIRREDVTGFVRRRPMWLSRPLGIKAVRKQAELMEMETRQFYLKALQKVTDASTRKLLGDLEEAERKHQRRGKQRGGPGRQTESRDADQHQIGGEDDEVAMSEIDEPHDAEDEAQPRSKQRIEAAQQDSLNEGVQPDHRRVPPMMRRRGFGSGRRPIEANVTPLLRNKRRGSPGV